MKKLLVIGAGFLQNFVICKAKAMGYTVLAVDANPQAIGFTHADAYAVINIVDEKACLEYAKSQKIDGVLTAATDYGVLSAAYVAREMGLPGIDYEVAKLIKNKYFVRKRLFERRVDDTKQAYEVDEQTDLDELCKKVVFPVMVKPCDGSGSRGASRVDDWSGFETACKIAMNSSLSRKATVETFIIGDEYGVESLVADGKVHVLGVMKKWMTNPPYYAELGHAIPCDLPGQTQERVKECVKNAIEALGVNFGSVNMDLLVTKDGAVHIIDVGARMGGNMIGPCVIPYGTGVDYMANMIKNALGEKLDWEEKEHGCVATRLLAFPQGEIKALPDFDRLQKDYDVEIYHHMQLGQKVNEYHTNLDGCGYIVAQAATVELAQSNANAVLQKIKETSF